jgi:hypothetical protein
MYKLALFSALMGIWKRSSRFCMCIMYGTADFSTMKDMFHNRMVYFEGIRGHLLCWYGTPH